MIGRLRGLILEKQPPEVLLEVGGVGYEIQMPMSCFYSLPEVGQEATLFTHFVVREDAQLLYGFNHRQERQLFREVIKANGVGPKLGLAILSAMTAGQFVACVEQEDVTTLVKIPGVGKKTAERLLVEMKDRLKGWSQGDENTDNETKSTNVAASANFAKDEAISALIALGYKAPTASKAVSQVATDGMTCEEMIRDALRAML